MTLSNDDQQAQLIAEVGDPNGTLALLLTVMWDTLTTRGAGLQYLYAKRAMLDVRLAEEQPSTDIAVGRNDVVDAQSQRFTHLQQMRADCQDEIVRVEALNRAQRAPTAGAITKTTPETPLYGPDPSWDRYRGSAIRDCEPW